jgi:hypothetical protein
VHAANGSGGVGRKNGAERRRRDYFHSSHLATKIKSFKPKQRLGEDNCDTESIAAPDDIILDVTQNTFRVTGGVIRMLDIITRWAQLKQLNHDTASFLNHTLDVIHKHKKHDEEAVSRRS